MEPSPAGAGLGYFQEKNRLNTDEAHPSDKHGSERTLLVATLCGAVGFRPAARQSLALPKPAITLLVGRRSAEPSGFGLRLDRVSPDQSATSLVQIVNFDQTDSGAVVESGKERGVSTRWQRCRYGRLEIVARRKSRGGD